jgi:hypothetical protein
VTAERTEWTCRTCGEVHHGLATAFGADAPQPWSDASDAARADGELTPDQCVLTVDGTTFHFLRGHIEIAITDSDAGPFSWSVWVSLSHESMDLVTARWDDPDRASLEPLFGWLSNELPYDVSTLNLATNVHTRAPGMVPLVEVDPSLDHPLVREQAAGITMHRLAEINREVMA